MSFPPLVTVKNILSFNSDEINESPAARFPAGPDIFLEASLNHISRHKTSVFYPSIADANEVLFRFWFKEPEDFPLRWWVGLEFIRWLAQERAPQP
jgi:hypothetical protein